MAKYRKKPVIIEARELEYTQSSRDEIAGWCSGITHQHLSGITIRTLEGDHYAQVGDFIIKGVSGEFYPCKPDIFWQTYEKVD